MRLPKFGPRRPVKQKSSKLYEDAMKPKEPVYEVASWKPLGSLVAYGVVMGGAGVGLCVAGWPVLGAAFLLVGVGPVAAVSFAANAGIAAEMGPRRASTAGDELGDYLGAGGNELVRTLSPRVDDHALEAIERNRAAEAAAARSWADARGGLSFEEVSVASDDGTRLVGHVLQACPGSDRWLVFTHGLDGCWRSGMTFARRFADAGYNLLFVELRAHGASGGAWVGAGWLDRRDLVAWCGWLVGRAGDGARIVLMGQSMGAAASIEASAEGDLPGQVVACVADCSYTDFWNVAIRTLRSGALSGKNTSVHPFIDLGRLFFKMRAGGYDLALARPVDALARTQVPTLIVHGAQDAMVPAHMAKKLAEAGGGHELLVVESAGHCTAFFADPEAYMARVLDFLGRFA